MPGALSGETISMMFNLSLFSAVAGRGQAKAKVQVQVNGKILNCKCQVSFRACACIMASGPGCFRPPVSALRLVQASNKIFLTFVITCF